MSRSLSLSATFAILAMSAFAMSAHVGGYGPDHSRALNMSAPVISLNH